MAATIALSSTAQRRAACADRGGCTNRDGSPHTAYDCWPMVLCSCGFWLHDYPAFGSPSSRELHRRRCSGEFLALADNSLDGDLFAT